MNVWDRLSITLMAAAGHVQQAGMDASAVLAWLAGRLARRGDVTDLRQELADDDLVAAVLDEWADR